jgi:two-component system response regulator AtoC
MEINCASLPENLIESELFGYEKGAFTDARQQRKGLLEIADRGTVFLDEIGEMPLSIQAKLLTFLEKKQFKRLGSGQDIAVDVRIIAATNQDLIKAIEHKKFRKDLYYRLNVVSIQAPPLRQRKDDILLLSNYFLEAFSKEMGKPPVTLLPEVETLFLSYPWYGNVRELRNMIERAVIFCRGHTVGKDLLPREMLDYQAPRGNPAGLANTGKKPRPIDTVLVSVEKQLIEDALKKTNGNKTQAARLLNISRYSLTRRINRLEKEIREQAC